MQDESYFIEASHIPDTDIDDVLKNPQPPFFKDELSKAEILAIHESLQLNKQALRAIQLLNAPYRHYILQWQRGRLFKALREYEHAIIAYQTAIRKLEKIRQHLTKIYREHYPNGERSEFREVLKPIFTELVSLLLEMSKTSPIATKNELLKQALQNMDKLKTAELRDYFQDDCTKPTIDLEEVESPNTAIIYPIFLSSRVEILVSLPRAQHFHKTVFVSSKQLTETINILATKLYCQACLKDELASKLNCETCRKDNSYRISAQRLYDWLLRPLEAELSSNGIHTIVFVPDGPLYSIPMAVLHDGQQFLIEKYALAIAPSLLTTQPTTKKIPAKML
ncbi:MAG: CHAT domain-containing protein, partial [bacterium]|nr:CHAT domain-containing protein [bacterium]